LPVIDVIIPAFNEEASIAAVIKHIPENYVRDVIVANNASTDSTKEVAKSAGATVVDQPNKGYGNACLKGLEHIENKNESPDIVVFLDGDFSDYPEQMPEVVRPIIEENADMVIGSRALGKKQGGSMMPQQIFGNWLATTLIRWFYGIRYTDLGPFRAIRYTSLKQIGMVDRDFGWTVEMQVKAAKLGLSITEVPVDYKKRIGVSKVTGTIKGTFMAGYKIIYTIFKYR